MSCNATHDADTCTICPEGLWCAGALALPEWQVRVKNGFWRASGDFAPGSTWETLRCAHPSHCWWVPYPLMLQAISRTPCSAGRRDGRLHDDITTSHCAGVQVGGKPWDQRSGGCKGGRMGRMCGRCKPGTFAHSAYLPCVPCHSKALWVVSSLVGILVLVGALYVATKLACMIRLQGIYALVSGASVLLLTFQYFDAMQALGQPMWLYYLGDFDRLLDGAAVWFAWPWSLDCLVESFIARRVLVVLLPLLLPVAAMTICMVLKLATVMQRNANHCMDVSAMLNATALLATALSGPFTCMSFGFFQCFSQSSGASSLWWSPDVACFAGEWMSALPVALLGVLLFPVAVLALQCYVARCLPTRVIRGSSAAASSSSWLCLANHRYLWMRLRPSTLFWDAISTARAMVVGVVMSLEVIGDISQLYCLVFLLLASLVALAVYRPHAEVVVTLLEAGSTWAFFFVVISRMSFHEGDQMHKSTSFFQMIVAVGACSYTAWTMCCLCKQLVFPKTAAADEERRQRHLTEKLQQLARSNTAVPQGVMIDRFSVIDETTLKQMSSHVMTVFQVLQPVSMRRTSTANRLCTYEHYDDKSNDELERSHSQFGLDEAELNEHMGTGLKPAVARISSSRRTSEKAAAEVATGSTRMV